MPVGSEGYTGDLPCGCEGFSLMIIVRRTSPSQCGSVTPVGCSALCGHDARDIFEFRGVGSMKGASPSLFGRARVVSGRTGGGAMRSARRMICSAIDEGKI